jgi:hypothetical protein
MYSNDPNVKLVEYKRSAIQGSLPKIDESTGKLTPGSMINLPKKYKCPQCGRLISARKFKEKEIETKNDNEQGVDKRGAGGFERHQF